MRQIVISEQHGAHHRRTIAAAVWIVVGIVAVIAFGDALTLLAVALAIVAAALWICREAEHRVKSNDARRYATGVGSRDRPLTRTLDQPIRDARCLTATFPPARDA